MVSNELKPFCLSNSCTVESTVFFSVVVPSLNQGKFLEQALCSLCAQKEDDLEIIVVDGGSTDASVNIIEKYSKLLCGERFGGEIEFTHVATKTVRARSIENVGDKDRPRSSFFWCSEPDRGQSHAFNKGFARASGRFLFWLNADDVLLPGTLARVRSFLSQGTIDWIAGDQIYIDADGKMLRCSCGNHWHDFLYRSSPVHVYGPSSFFSRELWCRVGGVDERLRYCMDWDLWLKFKKAGARFERLEHYCWAFRQHDGSKTQGGEPDTVDIRWGEIQEMLACHDCGITASDVLIQRLWRFFTGCYFRSMIDTLRFRGKRLDDTISMRWRK